MIFLEICMYFQNNAKQALLKILWVVFSVFVEKIFLKIKFNELFFNHLESTPKGLQIW